MLFRVNKQFHRRDAGFNMTPVIDIVFLLIIFFLVVCKFIEAENFPVTIPDNCKFARKDSQSRDQLVTVTVIKQARRPSEFAVGSKKIDSSDYSGIADKLAGLIDARMKNLSPDRRVVTLRIDKDVRFIEAQYALAAIAASTTTNIKLAALKDKGND